MANLPPCILSHAYRIASLHPCLDYNRVATSTNFCKVLEHVGLHLLPKLGRCCLVVGVDDVHHTHDSISRMFQNRHSLPIHCWGVTPRFRRVTPHFRRVSPCSGHFPERSAHSPEVRGREPKTIKKAFPAWRSLNGPGNGCSH